MKTYLHPLCACIFLLSVPFGNAASFTPAEWEKRVAEVRKKLPSDEFTIVVQPPFIVVGDGALELVKRAAEHQVKWAVNLFKKDFFTADPDEIIEIWLFKSATSYRKHTKEIFGDNPTTPFGDYSAYHCALITNIATGGGTLIHEIVPLLCAPISLNVPRGSTNGWALFLNNVAKWTAICEDRQTGGSPPCNAPSKRATCRHSRNSLAGTTAIFTTVPAKATPPTTPKPVTSAITFRRRWPEILPRIRRQPPSQPHRL